MAEFGYTTLFEPMTEGGYNVLVPAIPEICTYGETMDPSVHHSRLDLRVTIPIHEKVSPAAFRQAPHFETSPLERGRIPRVAMRRKSNRRLSALLH